jgi:HSP20 family molecular chaperone IbpA
MQRVIYLRRPLPGRNQRGLQQQLERAFHSQVIVVAQNREAWRPPSDVYETAAGLVVRVEMAGMRDAEITITLDERHLRIEGYRPERRDERPLCYHQMGVNYGTFVVEVFLARPFDAESVTARYDDGFLIVELPRPVAPTLDTRTRVEISEE